MSDALERAAARIADEVLFAAALQVDATGEIPASHFAALAAAGLYGIAGPSHAGGSDLDLRAQRRIRELLAGGCLTTAFVWAQHHGVVRGVRNAGGAVADAWLPGLCSGRLRGGLALAALRPGPSSLRIALHDDGGATLAGSSPMVTGWGYVDVLLAAARLPSDEIVLVLVETAHGGLHARPRRLAALDASRTVQLELSDVRVAADTVVRTTALPAWAAEGESVRMNGTLAVGVAARCARIAGTPSLVAAVDACRHALDVADDGDELARARAGASLLAMRAASYLVAERGSVAVDLREHAQRLAREAIFLLAFAQRPAIKEALLRELG
ncbi:MAG TPA: acyl-CoA dehydrogenase family protein [Solirubrobacteraceae bacterium]|nr:acyl-CoA dehydrogenase family protein [Solirubrobacteraceae bacterium]